VAEDALRQLRRRYDDLRSDYEALLERLADLETKAQEAEATAQPLRFGMFEQLLSPLTALRDEYVETLGDLERLVGGIEDLLPRGMKGQRPASATTEPAAVQVQVRGRNAGQLLDFRERLASLEGVLAVNIHAIDTERTVLIVELA
jgi:hypothetical protein